MMTDPDVVRLVLAARVEHGQPCVPIDRFGRRGCNRHLVWWDADTPTCGQDPIQTALVPFAEVQGGCPKCGLPAAGHVPAECIGPVAPATDAQIAEQAR